MINTDRFAAEAKFVRLRRYRDADVVMCYVSTKEEADTWWLLKTILQDGKLPAVPRVDGDTMEFYIIESLNAVIGWGTAAATMINTSENTGRNAFSR